MGNVFLFLVSVFLVFASDVSAACRLASSPNYSGSCQTPVYNERVWSPSVCPVGSASLDSACSVLISKSVTSCGNPNFSTSKAYYVRNSLRRSSCDGYTLDCAFYVLECATQDEADSAFCSNNPSAVGCAPPLPPAPDTSFRCQNAGGPVEGGFGGPRVAKLFRCVVPGGGGAEHCENTRDVSGTCSDWGFCQEGEDDCLIDPSLGKPPCGRSGPTFTTAARCYYACADGKDLNCKPLSTGYVAGNIYAGECPSLPPDGCRPSSSSSSGSSSSAGSSGSAGGSSGSGAPPADTVTFPGNTGEDYEIDYSAILSAIHDTLHRANVQRDFLLELQNASTLDLDNISNYSTYIYNSVDGVESALNTANGSLSNIAASNTGINNSLSSLQENGFNLVSSTANDISRSHELLDEINRYLRSDSLLSGLPVDTSYKPLLRDIKDAIDSIDIDVSVSSDSSRFVRDSAFARWWSEYSQDSAAQKGVLGKIWDNLKSDRDSVLSRNCTGFNECLAVYKKIDYCSQAWGVSTVDCVDGGSPFDNMLNVEGSILSTLWEAFWGEDSTTLDTVSRLDTNVTFSPQKDTAEHWLSLAFRSLFSPESTQAMLQRVERMKDSVERAKKDSVKVQPDSLWLDSSQAAAYVQDMLLPPGTVNECWVCHADLGTLGGLVPDGLSIHVDFGNFGGFDFCAIIRAVVKIAAFVVCMSLTLGSWMAAFGYNPKNDA